MSTDQDLAHKALPPDELGLFEALTSTRAIRRYTDDPVPEEALRAMLFAASRGPSGSNRQPFRFIVLRHGEKAMAARRLIGEAARAMWASKRQSDGYDSGSGQRADSPKARMARSMEDYVDNFEKVPLLILPCLVRYRSASGFEGASVYPAVQNLLLAARGLGFGGVITGFHGAVDAQLRTLLNIPEEALIAATITIGRPRGGHGPVRRRPLQELVFEDSWGESPDWAVDPPGTRYTRAGPPV
ncbi:MAG: nitroreductase family protein [Pseudomonadales bacterium]|nr:nitroreductase family protein [Pseudomonadales bacterium]